MKKNILFLLFSLFLASCGQSNSQISGLSMKEFTGSGFTLQIPEKWTTSDNAGDLPAPANGKIVLTSVSPDKKYNFSSNILVIEDTPGYLGTSTQYSEQNNLRTQNKYLEYQQIEKSDILFGDSDASKYFVFQAKYNNQTQKLKFVQTAKFCGPRIYLLHASMALDADAKTFVDIFRTFSCK